MYKNKIIELSRLSGKVGSKLKDPLVTEENKEEDEEQEFTSSITKIQRLLTLIQSLTEKIVNLKDAFRKARSQNQSSQKTKQMQKAVNTNNEYISELKIELEHLGKIVEAIKKKNPTPSAELQAIKLKHTNVMIKAQKIFADSRIAQDDFKIMAKQTMGRHINIINKDLTEQEREQITHNPEKMQQLLKNKLNNQASINLINNVADIQNKYKDILNLQKTINECFQMMQDLGVLVEYQGEQLNRIQMQIVQADDYVKHGQGKLVDAKKHYKSANKKICWIMMLVIVLLAVILIPVLVTKL